MAELNEGPPTTVEQLRRVTPRGGDRITERDRAWYSEADFAYLGIPEMTPEDVLPGCGFTGDLFPANYPKYFQAMIVKAITNPDWLLEKLDPDEVAKVQEAASNDQLAALAKEIDRKEKLAGKSTAIIVRALEMMSQEHPNLMFFRGTSFDPPDPSNLGIDYAPGMLPVALRHSEQGQFSKRTRPCLIMVPYSGVVAEYRTKNLKIGSENYWSRPSTILEMSSAVQERILNLRRPPRTEDQKEAVLDAFERNAVKLS